MSFAGATSAFPQTSGHRLDPGNEWVFFEPEVPDPDTAEEWGGVFLNWSKSGDQIEYGDFSYAENPLYLYWPGWSGTTAIRNCRVHDFADIGLWVQGTLGSGGAVIESCSVYRGDLLDPTLGRVGIYMDRADTLTCSGNTVKIETNSLGSPTAPFSRALEAAYGKTACESSPWTSRTLSITGNVLEGPGDTATPPAGGTSGFFSNYLCGGTNRTVEVTYNWIHGFNFSGLEFDRSSDVQVTCNRVEDNQQAVELRRDVAVDTTGAGVRFRTNYLEVQAERTGVVRSDNAIKTKLGGTLDKGQNDLRTSGIGTSLPRLLLEDEPGNDHDPLPASKNWWHHNDDLLDSISEILDSAFVWTTLPDTIDADPEDRPIVNVSNPQTDEPEAPCWDDVGESHAGVRGPKSVVPRGGVDPEVTGVPPGALPRITRIGLPSPNPTRGGAEVQLDVSSHRAGHYRIEIFDVAGRRVAILVDKDLAAGWYRVTWNGVARDGQVASPGTYFVRALGPGFQRNAKLVVVR